MSEPTPVFRALLKLLSSKTPGDMSLFYNRVKGLRMTQFINSLKSFPIVEYEGDELEKFQDFRFKLFFEKVEWEGYSCSYEDETGNVNIFSFALFSKLQKLKFKCFIKEYEIDGRIILYGITGGNSWRVYLVNEKDLRPGIMAQIPDNYEYPFRIEGGLTKGVR